MPSKIINFNSARKEVIEEKRREFERVVFKNALGVYTVIEQKGLQAIELLDISEGGLSFQVSDSGDFKLQVGEKVGMRFYFSSDSFIPIDIKIVRAVSAIENGRSLHQYGCLIDKALASYSAVYHLVQVIAKCAEHGQKDTKNLKVFY